MKDFKANKVSGALVPAGQRIDHDENLNERKQRELGAAFNRMNSDSEAEAQNAFAIARRILRDLGMSFDALLKASRETTILHEANRELGRQLHEVMRENAKYRSMNMSFKIKGRLVQFCRLAGQLILLAIPLLIVGALFLTGWVNAGGAAILVLPIGLYNTTRGLMGRYIGRSIYGILLLLVGTIGISVVMDHDAPTVHRRLAQLVENMNRDQELGPKTLAIDYPISHTTYVTTVWGIKDTLSVTIAGNATPVEISCAKYYENSITVRRSEAESVKAPDKPDIFHSIPVATFGACDLYAKLSSMH